MASARMQTVVVTVFEGKSFNPSLGFGGSPYKVYLTCRFNEEILSTDPVPLGPSPIWDTELAWDVDGKTLSFLKSQRVALKLVCFVISPSQQRINLGYIMLDLRAAGKAVPPPELWYSLVNTKHVATFRPAIKLAFAVVPKGTDMAYPGLPPADVPALKFSMSPAAGSRPVAEDASPGRSGMDDHCPSPARPPSLLPSTHGGPATPLSGVRIVRHPTYFQVGPQGAAQAQALSVVLHVAFAQHLGALLPAATAVDGGRQAPTSFHYYLPFLDVHVASSPFVQLEEPVSERLVLQFHGQLHDVRHVLQDMGKLALYVCGDDRVLGVAHIPLGPLEVGVAQESLVPVRCPDAEDAGIMDRSTGPLLGVAVQLAHADMVVMDAHTRCFPGGLNLGFNSPGGRGDEGQGATPATHQEMPEDHQDRHTFWSHSFAQPSLKDMSPIHRGGASVQGSMRVTPGKGGEGLTPASLLAPPTSMHRLRYSIDLRQVLEFGAGRGNVLFKYTYAPFGSIAPFMTLPLAITPPCSNALVPNSFCAFEFVMTLERLALYLEAVPLLVEMVERDEYSKDRALGTAMVDLSAVLRSPKQRSHAPASPARGPAASAAEILLQTVKVSSQVRSDEEGKDGVALLEVVLALEDFGPTHAMSVPSPEAGAALAPRPEVGAGELLDSTASILALAESPQPQATSANTSRVSRRKRVRDPMRGPSDPAPLPDTALSDSEEYRAVLELEVWKQEQRATFTAHLEKQQATYLARLTEEWRRREAQAERALTLKADKVERTRESANALLRDLQVRELDVGKREQALEQQQRELDRWKYLREEEFALALARAKSQAEHDLALQRQRLEEAEAGRTKWAADHAALEAKHQLLQQEFYDFKAAHPVMLRQSQETVELEQLRAALAQAKRDVDRLIKVKGEYKAQLLSLLAEHTKLKAAQKFEMQRRLEEEYQQVQEMKRAMRAKRELERAGAEKEELRTLRHEVQALAGGGRASYATPDSGTVLDTSSLQNIPPSALKEVQRLEGEKRTLLADGYAPSDQLIRDIDARMRHMML